MDGCMIPGYHVRKQKQIIFLIHDVKKVRGHRMTEECHIVSATAHACRRIKECAFYLLTPIPPFL